ncbi:hypothetical protein CR513_33251, partial [Mucuna pruriens]
MQGRGGGRDPFFDFGNPFDGFGGFGTFGPSRSLLPNFFGGRNPFDDPFFTRPFGSTFHFTPFGLSGNIFPPLVHPSGFHEHQAPERIKSSGPIIEELNSDDEKEDAKEEEEEEKENPRKHARSHNEPSIEHPGDEAECNVSLEFNTRCFCSHKSGKRRKYLQHEIEHNRFNNTGPKLPPHNFSFYSSTITYGGANGTYYTSSKTRRTDSDGVSFEECKEADSATRQATHVISRGIHSKGNSVSRKLNSNGKVETMQTLYNLNEVSLKVLGCGIVDELPAFEEAWKGKAQNYLPGWTGSVGEFPFCYLRIM